MSIGGSASASMTAQIDATATAHLWLLIRFYHLPISYSGMWSFSRDRSGGGGDLYGGALASRPPPA